MVTDTAAVCVPEGLRRLIGRCTMSAMDVSRLLSSSIMTRRDAGSICIRGLVCGGSDPPERCTEGRWPTVARSVACARERNVGVPLDSRNRVSRAKLILRDGDGGRNRGPCAKLVPQNLS